MSRGEAASLSSGTGSLTSALDYRTSPCSVHARGALPCGGDPRLRKLPTLSRWEHKLRHRLRIILLSCVARIDHAFRGHGVLMPARVIHMSPWVALQRSRMHWGCRRTPYSMERETCGDLVVPHAIYGVRSRRPPSLDPPSCPSGRAIRPIRHLELRPIDTCLRLYPFREQPSPTIRMGTDALFLPI